MGRSNVEIKLRLQPSLHKLCIEAEGAGFAARRVVADGIRHCTPAVLDDFGLRPRNEKRIDLSRRIPAYLNSIVKQLRNEREQAGKVHASENSIVEECLARLFWHRRLDWKLDDISATGYGTVTPLGPTWSDTCEVEEFLTCNRNDLIVAATRHKDLLPDGLNVVAAAELLAHMINTLRNSHTYAQLARSSRGAFSDEPNMTRALFSYMLSIGQAG